MGMRLTELNTATEALQRGKLGVFPVHARFMDGDGLSYPVVAVEVSAKADATVLVLGDPLDDQEGCADGGSYGGVQEAAQDAHQRAIADRAGLGDLHRPQSPQQPSEGGQWSRVGDTDYG